MLEGSIEESFVSTRPGLPSCSTRFSTRWRTIDLEKFTLSKVRYTFQDEQPHPHATLYHGIMML